MWPHRISSKTRQRCLHTHQVERIGVEVAWRQRELDSLLDYNGKREHIRVNNTYQEHVPWDPIHQEGLHHVVTPATTPYRRSGAKSHKRICQTSLKWPWQRSSISSWLITFLENIPITLAFPNRDSMASSATSSKVGVNFPQAARKVWLSLLHLNASSFRSEWCLVKDSNLKQVKALFTPACYILLVIPGNPRSSSTKHRTFYWFGFSTQTSS